MDPTQRMLQFRCIHCFVQTQGSHILLPFIWFVIFPVAVANAVILSECGGIGLLGFETVSRRAVGCFTISASRGLCWFAVGSLFVSLCKRVRV